MDAHKVGFKQNTFSVHSLTILLAIVYMHTASSAENCYDIVNSL